MSIESLFDALCNNANSVTRKIYEKRCSLAHETDRDKLNIGAMAYSRLEGILEGFKVAISEMKKHVGSDTDLPTSAKRSDGEDINVPTTPPSATADKTEAVGLPKWCKVGQWVFYNGCLLGKIEGFEKDYEDGSTHPTTYVVLKSYDTHRKLSFTRLPKQIQPVRFREYTFEEAEQLLGKMMKYTSESGYKYTVLIISIGCEYGLILVNGYKQKTLMERFSATIGGLPFGVPVVDEEAMKGGAK